MDLKLRVLSQQDSQLPKTKHTCLRLCVPGRFGQARFVSAKQHSPQTSGKNVVTELPKKNSLTAKNQHPIYGGDLDQTRITKGSI